MRTTRRTITSETDAFRGAFADSFGDITRFVQRRSASNDADAIVAETYLIAWRRWAQRPRSRDEVRPWLFGIARNVMRSTDRRETQRHRIESANTHGDPDVTGIDAFDTIATDIDVSVALRQLTPADREVILLAAWEDLDSAGIALALDITATAARVRLHRARRRLHQLLDPPQPRHGENRPNIVRPAAPAPQPITPALQRNEP
jgi:RNA polymerase sigma-70 factor, ECF subfamily